MKKYYCPYCGERTLKEYDKMILNPGVINFFYRVCSNCRNIALTKSHWITDVMFTTGILFVILFFFKLYVPFVLIGLISVIISHFLSFKLAKFVKSKGQEFLPYTIEIEFSDELKNPRLYFYGTSVLLAKIDDEKIPIRIDLVELSGHSGVCKFSFVREEKIEFIGKKVTLLDGDRIIGSGKCIE